MQKTATCGSRAVDAPDCFQRIALDLYGLVPLGGFSSISSCVYPLCDLSRGVHRDTVIHSRRSPAHAHASGARIARVCLADRL
jgi:hypothetical protein